MQAGIARQNVQCQNKEALFCITFTQAVGLDTNSSTKETARKSPKCPKSLFNNVNF